MQSIALYILLESVMQFAEINTNIYTFFAFALNESVIRDAPQFPMQNIYQSRDLSRANGSSNVIAASNVVCLLTFV